MPQEYTITKDGKIIHTFTDKLQWARMVATIQTRNNLIRAVEAMRDKGAGNFSKTDEEPLINRLESLCAQYRTGVARALRHIESGDKNFIF